MHTKRIALVVGFAVVVGVFFARQSCSTVGGTAHQNVHYVEQIGLLNYINVHLGVKKHLIVNGKRYEDVIGLKPYYLDVPQLSSILFVTRNGKDSVCHIVNLQNGEDLSVVYNWIDFGSDIGAGQPLNGTRVEAATTNEIVLADTHPNAKEVIRIDLEQRRVVLDEVLYLDSSGTITDRFVMFPERQGKR